MTCHPDIYDMSHKYLTSLTAKIKYARLFELLWWENKLISHVSSTKPKRAVMKLIFSLTKKQRQQLNSPTFLFLCVYCGQVSELSKKHHWFLARSISRLPTLRLSNVTLSPLLDLTPILQD